MRRNKSLPLRNVEQIAYRELSSFDGGDDFVDYAGYSDAQAEYNAYTGHNDPFVDFAGDRTSFNEAAPANERIYRMTIVNANLTDEEFYLNAGLNIDKIDVIGSSVDGLPVADGTFTSIAGNNLTMTGNPYNFKYFHNLVQRNPIRVVGMKVASTVATQMQTSILLERHSPFKQLQSRTLFLSSYQNETVYQDKQVTIPERWQIDDQLSVKMTIKASSTLDIQLFCGAVLNPAKALFKKAFMANNNQGRRYGTLALEQKLAGVPGGGASTPVLIGAGGGGRA